LKEKGLIEFVERKRDWHGRFGAYLYRVVHIAAAAARKGAAAAVTTTPTPKAKGRRKTRSTTGHGGLVAPNKGLTKRQEDTPLPPKGEVKEAYEWLFGTSASKEVEAEHRREAQKQREEESKRRRKGYEWLFE
jgi:hypothetical protein